MQTLDAIKRDLKLGVLPLTPDYDRLAQDLRAHKEAALKEGDQALAKHVWCLEHIIEVHTRYLTAFRQLKNQEYYQAWCSLEQVELAMGRLRRHFSDHWADHKIDLIEKIVVALQSLYPYRLFMSPEILELQKKCNICGKVISIRNPCGHVVGEIYNGESCCRIVTQCKFLSTAFVREPVQKYSVPFLVDPATGESRDHYNYATVCYLAERWPSPFADWSVEWTTREHPKSKFASLRRNEPCPCDSGKKYKKCCMRREGIVRPHAQFHFQFDVPKHLQTAEFSY